MRGAAAVSRRRSVAVLLSLAAWLASAFAHAEEADGTARGLLGVVHPEVAGRFMAGAAGFTPQETRPPLTGGGAGVRAGVSVLGAYAGVSYLNFLSESECLDSYPGSCSAVHAASYAVEVGYGHTFFHHLTVRGVLGVGDRFASSDGTMGTCSGSVGCTTIAVTAWHASRDDIVLTPSLLVTASFGPAFIGADATVFYMPSAGAPGGPSAPFASLALGGQLGLWL